MKQAALAAAVGRPQSWVSRAERGLASIDTTELEAIAAVLGCSAADLLPPPASPTAPSTWRNRDFVMVRSLHDHEAAALSLATEAIRRKLAASAQVYAVTSLRQVGGEVRTETHWRVDLTTRTSLTEPLTAFVQAKHHTVEVVGFAIASGSADHLDWINGQTAAHFPQQH